MDTVRAHACPCSSAVASPTRATPRRRSSCETPSRSRLYVSVACSSNGITDGSIPNRSVADSHRRSRSSCRRHLQVLGRRAPPPIVGWASLRRLLVPRRVAAVRRRARWRRDPTAGLAKLPATRRLQSVRLRGAASRQGLDRCSAPSPLRRHGVQDRLEPFGLARSGGL